MHERTEKIQKDGGFPQVGIQLFLPLAPASFPYRYYTGQKIAPILTIVIGGNHEASNYMWELYVEAFLLLPSKRLTASKLPWWMACTKHILHGACGEHPTQRDSHRRRFRDLQSKRLPTWRVFLSRFYHRRFIIFFIYRTLREAPL